MKKSRLNLLLERSTIQKAKRYSERHETSVSKLVGDFLSSLPEEGDNEADISEGVRRLMGRAEGEDASAYKRYLEDKHVH